MRISDWSSDVCSSDLRTRPCQGIGQLRPEPPPRPAVEAVVDRRRWSIVCRTVAPPAAGFQYMKDARNHPPVIEPSLTRLVPGKVRHERQPSFVRQPKSHTQQTKGTPSARSKDAREGNEVLSPKRMRG